MNVIFPTIKQDIPKICSYFFGKNGTLDKAQSRARSEEVTRAAVRMIAIFAMAISALTSLTYLPFLASDPVGAVLMLAIKVFFCAICYDIFTITKNKSDQTVPLTAPFKKAAANFSSTVKDLKDLVTGTKSPDDAPRHSLTENTIFRRIWDIFLE